MFPLVDMNLCDEFSNYCPFQRIGAHLIIEGGLLDNPVSWIGSYSSGALNRGENLVEYLRENAISHL